MHFDWKFYLPILIASGISVWLRCRRGDQPVDYGPWKMMAWLIALNILSVILTVIWITVTAPDFQRTYWALPVEALIADLLLAPSMVTPSLYIGAGLTGLITGTKRPLAYIVTFSLLAPLIALSWFYIVFSYACWTRGACL